MQAKSHKIIVKSIKKTEKIFKDFKKTLINLEKNGIFSTP